MIRTVCDAGCKEQFTIQDFQHGDLGDGVEKTYFTCPHCLQEYVAFYTDAEIRKLQEKIRKVQSRFAKQHYDPKAGSKQEAKLKKQIKEKMDALRNKIEGSQCLD